jgi:hypothetical protein
VGDDGAVIWVVFVVALLLVLVLYRRMLGGIAAVVPARTHLTGWRDLGAPDGADTWVFAMFVIGLFALLALDWPVAVAWVLAVFAGMELLRRRHNSEPTSS